MTSTIFENCNSLGSRLHKSSDTKNVAYAQWPDETTFRESKLPNDFEKLRTSFKKSCNKVKVLFELEMVDDLLK